MTDAKDTRDKPVKRRARRDAHADWEQQRVTQKHRTWLEGNGSLTVHHFTSNWEIVAREIPPPETEALQQIATAYNEKMLQTAIVDRASYRVLFKEMATYETQLRSGLTQDYPQLSGPQANAIADICESFTRDWVKKSFKASFELAGVGTPKR